MYTFNNIRHFKLTHTHTHTSPWIQDNRKESFSSILREHAILGHGTPEQHRTWVAQRPELDELQVFELPRDDVQRPEKMRVVS